MFKSSKTSPRVIITKALMIGIFDDQEHWIKVQAMGVSNYGQMKAGGWMYIGPQGTYFFDYGNSFLKAIYDAGEKEISKNGIDDSEGFIFPSYVEDIMGPMLFDYGYGPFRWVCLSGKDEDLRMTDKAAMDCIDPDRRGQDRDNYNWIRDAGGRLKIALKFNEMVRSGQVGPIMLGRDHHDVSGTDSPFRETVIEFNKEFKYTDHITLPFVADESLVQNLIDKIAK